MPPSWLPLKSTWDIINNATTWAVNVHNALDALADNLGTASNKDTGTANSQIPLNSDLGTAAVKDTGTGDDQLPLNSDLGDAAHLGTYGSGSIPRQSIIDGLELGAPSPKRLWYGQHGAWTGSVLSFNVNEDIDNYDLIEFIYQYSISSGLLSQTIGYFSAKVPRLKIPVTQTPANTNNPNCRLHGTLVTYEGQIFYMNRIAPITSGGITIIAILGSNWRT